MAITDRILEALGIPTKLDLERRAAEAYMAGYNDGNDEPASGTLASYGYSRAGGGGRRDPKMSWQERVEGAWNAFSIGPPAERGLELKRDHILGRGIEVTTEDESLEEIFDEFRENNQFDTRIREYTLQLFLFGGQCFPVAVRQADGRVLLNYIDPGDIEDIIVHPNQPQEFIAVVVKAMEGLPAWAGTAIPRRVYRIIRYDTGYVNGKKVVKPNYEDKLVTAEQAQLEPWEAAMLNGYGLSAYSGSTFYFIINALSNQPFGVSDLQRAIYWLDKHDTTLVAMADGEQSKGYWYNDTEMVGATPEQVRQRATELRHKPIGRQGYNVHTDREKHEIKQPNIGAASSTTLDSIFDYAWGGLGFPRHWYVQGDSTNRATAQEQAGPTEKTLQSDQDTIKEMIVTIFTFVRDQAQIAGYLADDDQDFDVIMPEIATRNIAALSVAMEKITATLVTAMQNELVSSVTATKIWGKLISELGVEIDPAEEEELIADEEPDEVDTVIADNEPVQAIVDEVWRQANGNR